MGDWLRNCWYMAGWSHEVGENGLARRIIDRPVFPPRSAARERLRIAAGAYPDPGERARDPLFLGFDPLRRLDSAETDALLTGMFAEAFDQEDKPMIEAAYANVRGADFWSEKPVSLGIDQGGTRARRMLEKMIRDERGAG